MKTMRLPLTSDYDPQKTYVIAVVVSVRFYICTQR